MSTTAPTPGEQHATGARVELTGLSTAVEHNGAVAYIVKWNAKKARYTVVTEAGTYVSVRCANVRQLAGNTDVHDVVQKALKAVAALRS